jgi:hypothetical protein
MVVTRTARATLCIEIASRPSESAIAIAAQAICSLVKVGLGPVRAVRAGAIIVLSGNSMGAFRLAFFNTLDVFFIVNLDACFRHTLPSSYISVWITWLIVYYIHN